MIKKTQAKYMTASIVETLSFLKKVYLTMFQIFTIIAQFATFSSMTLSH